MASVKFELDMAGGRDILTNNAALNSLVHGTMASTLGDIEAQFFQTFNVPGKFELVDFTTDRTSAKISAGDAKTARILAANPKWLSTFINNLSI